MNRSVESIRQGQNGLPRQRRKGRRHNPIGRRERLRLRSKGPGVYESREKAINTGFRGRNGRSREAGTTNSQACFSATTARNGPQRATEKFLATTANALDSAAGGRRRNLQSGWKDRESGRNFRHRNLSVRTICISPSVPLLDGFHSFSAENATLHHHPGPE